MRLWDILQSRLRSLFFRDRRESDLSEELQFHLEREMERLQACGMPRDAARLQALRRFGGADQVKEASRDARGTGFVDDTIRDVRYAVRGLARTPLVAFTIVSTVALGLGLVTVAFTFLNMFLFRVDQVPNVHEMFAVVRPRTTPSESVPFTRAKWEALRRETNVFTDAYAEVSGIDFPVDGRTLLFTLTTGNFFQVVGVSPVMGRTLTPADDEPVAGRPVMVLSDRGWDRLFARDPAILGRAVVVKGVSFEIVGVMPKGFRGLAVVPPDYWVPLSMAAHIRPNDGSREADAGVEIVGRLKPGTSRQAAAAQLAAWDAGQASGAPIDPSTFRQAQGRPEQGRGPTSSGSSRARAMDERGASTLTLLPRRGTVQQPREAVLVTAPLFFAFGLILLIGCANVANLLLARAVARQREIGIRLSLGAARRRIVRQLLTESLLLALVAAAAGFAISRVALQALVNAMLTTWPPEIGDLQLLVPESDWRVLLFLVLGACVATVCFGLLPALQATRIDPITTMRGEIVKDARPGRARDVLIGLQVSVSALLLICAAVFLRSAFAATAEDPGIRISDTVMIGIPNEGIRTAMVQAVTAEPSVAVVAASWPGQFDGLPALAESDGARGTVAYRFVSPEYFSVLGISVVRGRAFNPAERMPSLSLAVVSETTARTLWPNADPVGQVLRLDPDHTSETGRESPLGSRSVTVIGVVRDVAGFRIVPIRKALVYLPTSAAMPNTGLVARVQGDPDRARQTLLNRLSTIDPKMDQVGTLRSIVRMETYFLQLGFWSTVGLGGLGLVLTLSGLFSVLSYLVEQRTKEIGVRMALGATMFDVTRLVLTQLLRPVGVGLFIGATSAAGLSALLLTTPAADIIGEVVHLRDPIAYGTSLLLIMMACLAAASVPATRAARLDPTQTLRQE